EVNGSGVVQKVPASGNCPMEGHKHVKSYPVQERAGAIFLWFGIDPNAEPAPLELPEDLVSEEYSQFLCVSNWKVNYRYAIDNVMDPMHGAYLHATSHSMRSEERRVGKECRS